MRSLNEVELDALVEAATVDCYNDDEQLAGLHTLIVDNLTMPLQTHILGVEVTVDSVDLASSGQIVAICHRGSTRQAIPILELPLPTPPPVGAEWIEAYRRWVG